MSAPRPIHRLLDQDVSVNKPSSIGGDDVVGWPKTSSTMSITTTATSRRSSSNDDHQQHHGFADMSVRTQDDHTLLEGDSFVSSKQQKTNLPFSTLGLVGRSQEVQTLQAVIDTVIPLEVSSSSSTTHQPAQDPHHTMVFISGHSGTGKSALAMNFQQQSFNRHAFFVSGKFDLQQMEEPYSGIKAALAGICQQMLALRSPEDSSSSGYSTAASVDDSLSEDPRRFSVLQSLLASELSANEIQILSKVIPDILKVVEEVPTDSSKIKTTTTKPQRSPSLSSSATGSISEGRHGAKKADRVGYREHSERLKFVLQRFIQITCQFCPVVIVIDDLQWGDKSSMELLQSWMFMHAGGTTGRNNNSNNEAADNGASNRAAHSLLIMGCFRSDTAEHNQILQGTIDELKSAQEARSISIIELQVGDMEVPQVHELVCGLLLPPNKKEESSESDSSSSTIIMGNHKSLALAHLVHKRTGGNVFFVKQFLHQLFLDGLIYFDLVENCWEWKSEAEITEKSAATTNIVDLMKDKIKNLQAARQILPIAACLGATFSTTKLTMVIRTLSIHSDHATFVRKIFDIPRNLKDSWTSDILRSCEREGLIEFHRESSTSRKKTKKRVAKRLNGVRANIRHDMYTFVHDKVQEASFSLIPADSVTELQYRVGEALLACLSSEELCDDIFMVASLLNLRHDLVPHAKRSDRRMKIAMLNNMAGEKAVSCGAFQSALSYFKTAIGLLPEGHWESQFRESLDLYSSVAECSFVTSDMEQVHLYSAEVIKQNCSMLDKIRAYHIMIDVASAKAENNKDLDPVGLCLLVLSELGCKFPRSKVAQTFITIRGMIKMKRRVPKWTVQEFDNVPACTDAKELAITKTLSKLTAAAFLSRPEIAPLAILKLMERTLEHGISQHSLPSFGFMGLIVGYFMGDFHSALKLSQISLRLLNRIDAPETKALTQIIVYSLCSHWTTPIEDTISNPMESYRVGMASGDVESACWALYNHIDVNILVGTPLPIMDDDMARYMNILKDFRQTNQHQGCAMLRQAVHNLQGKTENRSLLVGDIYDEEAEFRRLDSEPNAMRRLGINNVKLFAAVHFGDFAVGAKIAVATFDVRLKNQAGALGLPPGIFYSGVCCYAICSDKSVASNLRKKYRKTAQKCRAKLRQWQEKGNPNCDLYVALLNAEHCALKGRYEPAIKNYAIAMALAKSRRYIQYEAMTNERLADHLMKGNDKPRAQEYMTKAIVLTEEWGASAKVRILHGKYDEFLAAPTLPSSSGRTYDPSIAVRKIR